MHKYTLNIFTNITSFFGGRSPKELHWIAVRKEGDTSKGFKNDYIIIERSLKSQSCVEVK